MRRGLSTLLAATLVSAVALAAFASLYALSQRRALTSVSGLERLSEYVHQHEVTRLAIVVTGSVAHVRNLGNKPVELEHLVLLLTDGSLRVVRLSEGDPCWRLDVDGTCSLGLEEGLPVVAVTRSGVIVYPERVEMVVPTGEAALIIPITFPFASLSEFAEEFGVSQDLVNKPYPGRSGDGKRGVSGETLLILPRGRESEYFNELVSTDCPGSKDARTPFGVLVVGYDPNWVLENKTSPGRPPRFSIMFTGPQMPGERICTRKETLPLTQQGFRIKILNFTGTIRIYDSKGGILACSSSTPGECGSARSALGVWYYGIDLGWSVYFHGIAGYLAYYQRAPSGQAEAQESSYEPYLFLGDVDGNGVVDLLFVTEDAYYGDRTKINDSKDLVDYSTVPLRLKLLRVGRALGYPDGSVDGSRFAGIILYVNLLFHDNSHPDERQLEDNDRTDWVMRILLVDGQGNEYVVREYRYQEICNYHKTLVRDVHRDNYFVKISQSVFVPIPSSGRYWIAIELRDPYYLERRDGYYINDADLTVGIEIIGVLPLAR